ncbi:peroxide/acid stress response protein YhcN [Rahnella sp. C60]|uniref:Peroxide/acid stress response protein YhcN n=1 Tax=Rahnella perminowiae TaxID=2816244 RepID=A0ABS6L0I1_9GAMM|nr:MULTISPECIES: peroxide/acid stress response protein YhcN [Rahnella]UJD87798.1 peroxide/acid stress response protein YhcN [Rahnella aquatilis]MBU9808995.1 peroxide/acid stress response protein YhcN [Rahnella perminowiae]MBU9814803.1 peroxide/acid stress response protein YhcN [Rahnella perminowiae]MBU9827114.1 peroxide/acid stress response protein YhcN [Rahnella perminowiae]MBU9835226.1 peroxide/acid stress response protein YhcN [Rahnella perminowiae]
MKIITTIAALSLLSAVSFATSAAQLVTNQQAENLRPMGTISVSGVNGVPMDIRQQLSDKAESKGAKSFRVIEAYNNGAYHATAEIYQ